MPLAGIVFLFFERAIFFRQVANWRIDNCATVAHVVRTTTTHHGEHIMTTSPMTFRFISDPGHGWIEIRPEQAAALGLTPADLTEYSYRAPNGTLYAEEDADAFTLLAAHHKATGAAPTLMECSGTARGFARCSGARADWRAAMAYVQAHPDARP
jgi:hypothetical protein